MDKWEINKALKLAAINEGIKAKNYPLVETYEQNTTGRDFVVGDIHGCFTKLRTAMGLVGFDESMDRLFAVGDLVDRGPESDEVCEWLAQPWFHSVRGNHDHFVVEFMEGPFDKGMYLINGGLWFLETLPEERPYYYEEIKKLPLMIEVDTPTGKVGIVHADIAGNDWNDFKERLEEYFMYAMWGRLRITQGDGSTITGIDRVYAGHTPVPEPYVLGNVHYIDMGVCFKNGGDFYLEQIN